MILAVTICATFAVDMMRFPNWEEDTGRGVLFGQLAWIPAAEERDAATAPPQPFRRRSTCRPGPVRLLRRLARNCGFGHVNGGSVSDPVRTENDAEHALSHGDPRHPDQDREEDGIRSGVDARKRAPAGTACGGSTSRTGGMRTGRTAHDRHGAVRDIGEPAGEGAEGGVHSHPTGPNEAARLWALSAGGHRCRRLRRAMAAFAAPRRRAPWSGPLAPRRSAPSPRVRPAGPGVKGPVSPVSPRS